MGYDNRDYAYGAQPGIHLQPPQTVTMKLVLITFGVYVLQVVLGEAFSGRFVLTADWFVEPWRAYTLLSYGFLHDPRGVQHIFIYNGHPNGPAGVFRLTRTLNTPKLAKFLKAGNSQLIQRARRDR